MTDVKHPTAWQPLIDAWIEREQKLRPHLPVKQESVRVRDAVEIADQAFVLLSFDVDHPWPSEEHVSTSNSHTAIIQAERVRQPWIERDASRAAASWHAGEEIVVREHLLGSRRALSGVVPSDVSAVVISFDGDQKATGSVVDGWFLVLVDHQHPAVSLTLDKQEAIPLSAPEVIDVDSLLAEASGSSPAGDAMYFSPLDLRSVKSIVQWQRSEDVVVVATCVEQYDEGGILRLRIDGIRTDDDTFVSWPDVILECDGVELSSSVCGESALADTISLDIGFKPWLPQNAKQLKVTVAGARGESGEVAPVALDIKLGEG